MIQFAQGNNLPRVKATNQSSILQMIYHCGPIKRTDIAEQLGLTLPTITTNVNDMIALGLVRELDKRESAAYPGRKAHPVDIVPEARYFVGIEMQGYRRTACVLDFRGRTVAEVEDSEPCGDYEKNVDLSAALARRALEKCGMSLEEISGLGICVPGLVNSRDGILDSWPSYGWRGKRLQEDTAAALGYGGPVNVENNACVRAYGARLAQRELLNMAQNFAYLFISRGIACPLFINIPNAFGSVVGAGEIGHMIMEPNGLPCSCGNHGCLEAYASDRAVTERCVEALERGGAAELRRICGGESPGMEQIVQAQEAGDPEVCEIVDGAVYRIGIAVANVNNFACPRIMFIDGVLFRFAENRRRLLEVVHSNLCNVIHTDTEFIFVDPDEFGGARGAAALAVCKYLELSQG